MDITLNGAPCRVACATVAQLLAERAIDGAKPGIAVALNDTVVPRSRWHSAILAEGDAVEIVRPHSGG
jgi:sulfur carrier protein